MACPKFDRKNKKHVICVASAAAAFVLIIIVIVVVIVVVNGEGTAAQKAALDLHNELRKKHHAGPLKLSSKLNSIAQKCAKYYADKGTIDHSCPHVKGYGENLYKSFGSEKTFGDDETEAKKAVQAWYDEIKDYDFSNRGRPYNFGQVGHFTQLVWAASKELGFGLEWKKNSPIWEVYIVGVYDPRGNFNSDYGNNVLPK